MNHFAEFGPVDKPGHCRWCGKKLRKKFDSEHVEAGNSMSNFRKLDTFKLGDYGDGHFCGPRCGYRFGVRLANLGSRLVEKKP